MTDLVLGTMIAFGADIVLVLGFAWAAGYVSAAVFAAVTALIVSFYGGWIGWRWWELRSAEPTERAP